MWDEVLMSVVQALVPILTALLIALIGYGIAYVRKAAVALNNAVAREALDAALAEAERVAVDAVQATQQKLVDGLKARSADGKLTQEEARQAMMEAQEYFIVHVSGQSLKVLQAALGPIEEWLDDYLEAKLGQVKTVKSQVQAMARPN